MIGGAKADVARCETVLVPLGNIMRCGDIGSGQVMKLANNAISLSTFSLLLEVRDLVSTYGMDLEDGDIKSLYGTQFRFAEFPHAKRAIEDEGHAGKRCSLAAC